MQQTALTWLVFRLTRDAFQVGLNNFASQVPSLVLMPLAGVLVERCNLLRTVIVTQVLSMVQAFILAGLVFFNVGDVWPLMVLAFGLGCVNCFDLPARQSLLPDLLEKKEDLANAIALNSSLFNAARLVGPALAGQLIALSDNGEGWCFLLNGVSFLAVLASLMTIKVKSAPRPKPGPVLQGLYEGLSYAWGHAPTRGILITVAIVGFAGLPYAVLVPVFADDVLHGDAQTYGLLLTASGVGALVGGIYLASRVNIRGSASRIVVSGLVAAACLAAFAFSGSFWVSMTLMLLASMNMMLMLVSSNALVQSIVPDDKRARVLSLYAMAVMGTTPFGALIAGSIARQWGPKPAMLICAGGCLLGAAVFIPWLGVVRAAIRAHVGHPTPAALEQPAPPDFVDTALTEDARHV